MFKIGVVLFLCLLFVQPERAMSGAREGLLLWYSVVLPAQLPFVVGVRLLFKIASLNKMPVLASNFLLGLVSGFPVGAMTAGEFYKQGRIDRQNLTAAAAFSNMAGPLFVVGTVGTGILKNSLWGYCLLLVQWASALLLIIFPAWRERHAERARTLKADVLTRCSVGQSMEEAVGEAAELMLKVGGFVVLFSVLRQWMGGPVGAMLELTGGIRWLAQQEISMKWILAGCSFLINFSGICVIMQSLGANAGVPISGLGFVGCKLLQGLIGMGIMLGICQFLRM